MYAEWNNQNDFFLVLQRIMNLVTLKSKIKRIKKSNGNFDVLGMTSYMFEITFSNKFSRSKTHPFLTSSDHCNYTSTIRTKNSRTSTHAT